MPIPNLRCYPQLVQLERKAVQSRQSWRHDIELDFSHHELSLRPAFWSLLHRQLRPLSWAATCNLAPAASVNGDPLASASIICTTISGWPPISERPWFDFQAAHNSPVAISRSFLPTSPAGYGPCHSCERANRDGINRDRKERESLISLHKRDRAYESIHRIISYQLYQIDVMHNIIFLKCVRNQATFYLFFPGSCNYLRDHHIRFVV